MKIKVMKNCNRKIGKFHMHMRQGIAELNRGDEKININICGDVIGFEATDETRTIKLTDLAEEVFKKKYKDVEFGCAYCGKKWEDEQEE